MGSTSRRRSSTQALCHRNAGRRRFKTPHRESLRCLHALVVFKTFGVIYNYLFKDVYLKRKPHRIWPLAEVAIPSILHLLEDKNTIFQPPLIKVPKKKKVSCKSIDRMIERRDGFGLKKIARDTDSEAFHYVMHLQTQAGGEA